MAAIADVDKSQKNLGALRFKSARRQDTGGITLNDHFSCCRRKLSQETLDSVVDLYALLAEPLPQEPTAYA